MFHQESEIQQAADEIYKAMKGAGTDESVIIAVASRFTADEREAIAKRFTGTYGKTLEGELKRELSGNLEKLFVPLFQGRWKCWARYLHEAVKGAGTDEQLLIEQVFLLNDEAQKLVLDEYRQEYNSDLLKDIEGDISLGKWANLIRAWIYATNDSAAPPEQIADALYKAAKGAGTDEQTIMNILTNCHPNVYHEACDIYVKKYGKTVPKMLAAEFAGKSEDAFLAAHYTLYDFAEAVARQIKLAFKGAGTDEDKLIRLTVLFSDRLGGNAIKEGYSGFGDLVKDAKRDLTGKFEKAILGLWKL